MESSAAPKPGSLIADKYRIDRLLGEGGMGMVFAAENTVTGKRVALKWMHRELAEHPEASARFLREAQASARVQHPNVVDVYDVLGDSNGLFMVMQLLDGEPLSALMERGTTGLPELITLLIGAMRGVAAAHRQGIVHRDVKPDNIFLARVDGSGHVIPKVLDFGISKLSGLNDASITKTGMALGTPLYMSVEQLSGLKDIDARTDIYAFGVILYQAVTGQPPFNADTYPVLVAKIMTEQALPPKQLRPEIPMALSRLIEWSMAKDRNQRIATLDEFVQELEPFASDAGFRNQMTVLGSEIPNVQTPSARPAALPLAETAPAPKPPSRAPAALASASVKTATPLATEAAPPFQADTTLIVPTRSRLPVIVAAAVLATAIATWLAMRSSGDVQTAAPEGVNVVQPMAVAEPPSVPVAAPIAAAPAEPVAAETPAPSIATPSGAAPSTTAPPPEAPVPALSPPASTPHRTRASTTARRVSPAPAKEPSAPTTAAAPTTTVTPTAPAAPIKVVKGRAGSASSDQF